MQLYSLADIRTREPPVPLQLTLVSHPLCPYVQRAAIVLREKGLPFMCRDSDLADKHGPKRHACTPRRRWPARSIVHGWSSVPLC